ncbi:STE3 [Candida oxycetoniae]|uniref:STE3 n=1 Tax=Candida oxycetoniae TaxID=497107 RepID=A0AAI9T275_9ASCO|nr:STE3 [Candida oxycetoniae]KAI3407021.1 STE3 [Candida oxycetoniae]
MNSSAAGTAAFAFIAFFLLIPAFIWHGKCRNIAATLLIFWLMLIDLIGFVNTMIWSGADFDQVYSGKGWCDLTLKLEVGASIGKLCAITCISMNLYMILCAQKPIFMDSKSWKKIVIDLAICLVFPIFIMCVNYIIQSRRFAILRYRGCSAIYSNTNATIGLYLIWPIIWSFIAFVFAALTLYKYIQKRKDVKDILMCTNSGLNIKRFARLLLFCVLVIFGMMPLAIFYFVDSVGTIREPFHWSQVHDDKLWGVIEYYDFGYITVADKLVNSMLSIIAFLLFGLGSDALQMYKSLFRKFSQNTVTETLPLSKQSTYVQNGGTPTKFNSPNSQFSRGTNFSDPTMREFDDFTDVIKDLGIDQTDVARNVDQEKGATSLVECDEKGLGGDFLYTYEVKQKP